MADFTKIARKRDKLVADMKKLEKQLNKSSKGVGNEFTPKLAKQFDYDVKYVETMMKDLEKFYKEVQRAAR